MADPYRVLRAFCRPEPSGMKTYGVGDLVTFDTPEQAIYHVDAGFVAMDAPAAAPAAEKPAARPSRGRKAPAVTAPDPDPDDDDIDEDTDDDDDE